MYHIELRQFPHNLCRFNLGEQELRALVLDAWARGDWVDVGERKWSPHQATLTVIEGPELPLQELSMGRGWRAACRHGEDVTARVLDVARRDAAAAASASATAASPAALPTAGSSADPSVADLAADSIGLELLTQLADAPSPLHRAWELAAARYPDRAASECLAVAERAVASLLRARLVVLVGDLKAGKEMGPALDPQALADVLRAPASWGLAQPALDDETPAVQVHICRA